MESASIQTRFHDLETWAKNYTETLESEIRTETGMNVFHCFVMDQFEAAFPEDHVTRDGQTVFVTLRLALDLKALSKDAIVLIKAHIEALRNQLSILRDNFQDSPLRLDFDWHISEKERSVDQGIAFAHRVRQDCFFIKRQLDILEDSAQNTC